MNNTSTGTTTDTRTPYGFELEFPNVPFTISDLRQYKNVPYITLKKRVNLALGDGELVLSGKKSLGGRGRPMLVYTKATSATAS